MGIAGGIVVILLVLIAGIIIYNISTDSLSRQLDLGNKYLEEQNYEQAIVEFDKAIEIDPMSVDAYLGLAEAYLGLGNDDMAVQILEEGYEITGDARILNALEVKKNINDVSNVDILEIETEDNSSDIPKIVSEDELRKILEKDVSEPVVSFIYDDFDYNGTYEAIALCGEVYLDEEYPEFSTYYGTIYFVTENEVKVIRTNDDYWTSGEVFDFGDAKIFCINKYFTTGALSFLYQVEGDKIVEIAGSGKGNYFSQEKEGWISMTDSQYDASVDGTGHTWNVYYFYWDGSLHEYGGTLISMDVFSNYTGADVILKKIADDGFDIRSIYGRQNGIVNINCSDEISNVNVRVFLDNKKVEVMSVEEGYFYESGIIKPALVPEIATYSS